MSKTARRTLEFDSLEGKVLLSSGLADPAATVSQRKALHLQLRGKLYGLPSGASGPDGYSVSSFPVNGHVVAMGNVSGAFFLRYTFISYGKLPDLSKSNLVLQNQNGSVRISLNATGTHHYKFMIMSGTGSYTNASGTGYIAISSRYYSLDFTIKMYV
jgi:hypothetical protein